MFRKILVTFLILFFLSFNLYAENKWGQTKPVVGSQLDYSHPLSRGLVGCWLMNEGGGSIVGNLYRNKHATAVSGKSYFNNNGMYFSGVAGQEVTQLNYPQLNLPNNFSLVVGAKVINSGSNQMFNSFESSGGYPVLNINSDNLRFISDATISLVSTPFASFYNKNVQIVATSNFNNTVCKLYLNSILKGTGNYGVNFSSANKNLLFGVSGIVYLKGTLYYFYIYNRALSLSEIQSLYIAPYQMIKMPSIYDLFQQAQEEARRRMWMVN